MQLRNSWNDRVGQTKPHVPQPAQASTMCEMPMCQCDLSLQAPSASPRSWEKVDQVQMEESSL